MNAVAWSEMEPWAPRQLGLHRAIPIALAIEALLVFLLTHGIWHHTTTPPPAMPQQVTTVDFVKLPPPPPPTPPVPKVVPRIVTPPPLPKPDIVVPKRVKPKPVVHHRPRPVHHVKPKPKIKPKPKPKPRPKARRAPQPKAAPHPARQVVKAPHPTPRVAPVSGPTPSAIAVYAQALHVLIQNNVVVGPMIQQLGLSGAVRVRFTLGSSGGHVRAVKILSANANPLIRKAALKTVRQISYPPFPKTFGSAPRAFEVTVQINVSD